MSAGDVNSGDDDQSGGREHDGDPDALAGELAILREENERLRREYARARRSQYRRSAATLVAVGVLTFVGGGVVVGAQTVLFALGGTGVFLGVMIYFLTPERFISASVGEAVYTSLARNASRMVAELGLEDEWVYVPLERDTEHGTGGKVTLFVPRHADYDVPETEELAGLFVVTDDGGRRGVAFRPTAADLYGEFVTAGGAKQDSDPSTLATELSDSLVEQFELVERATVAETGPGRVAVRVSGSAVGRVDRFDHPVASLLGVGLARAVENPVTVEVTPVEDGAYVVSCLRVNGDDAGEQSPSLASE